MHRTGSVKALWACLGENTLTSKNYIDLRFIWVYRSMQKTKVISQAFLELLKFQESFNRIGLDRQQNWACFSVSDQNQAKE